MKNKLTEEQRQVRVDKLFSTIAGRKLLAQTMIGPIKQALYLEALRRIIAKGKNN